jgi:hypothetical protein
VDGHDVEAIRKAWREASVDLGIQVQTDFWIEDLRSHRHELVGLVPEFGGTNGMAILQEWDPSLADLAALQGFGYTVLGGSYQEYDRRLFEDTLNDWQWTAEAEPPKWYTGAA